jgi:hypothetical protein
VTPSTVRKTELAIPASNLLRSRMPELDTIRGIAVLLVLFFTALASATVCTVSRVFQGFLSQLPYPVGWA